MQMMPDKQPASLEDRPTPSMDLSNKALSELIRSWMTEQEARINERFNQVEARLAHIPEAVEKLRGMGSEIIRVGSEQKVISETQSRTAIRLQDIAIRLGMNGESP
jgi:hypothetical protein